MRILIVGVVKERVCWISRQRKKEHNEFDEVKTQKISRIVCLRSPGKERMTDLSRKGCIEITSEGVERVKKSLEWKNHARKTGWVSFNDVVSIVKYKGNESIKSNYRKYL